MDHTMDHSGLCENARFCHTMELSRATPEAALTRLAFKASLEKWRGGRGGARGVWENCFSIALAIKTARA